MLPDVHKQAEAPAAASHGLLCSAIFSPVLDHIPLTTMSHNRIFLMQALVTGGKCQPLFRVHPQ